MSRGFYGLTISETINMLEELKQNYGDIRVVVALNSGEMALAYEVAVNENGNEIVAEVRY